MSKYPISRFFDYKHLPKKLQLVSRPFNLLARVLTKILPYDPETYAALRKLLEAKDCAVRASLLEDTPSECIPEDLKKLQEVLGLKKVAPKVEKAKVTSNFKVDETVLVFDRYRLATPAKAIILFFSPSNDGVALEVLPGQSKNFDVIREKYPNFWVHTNQLRKIENQIKKL